MDSLNTGQTQDPQSTKIADAIAQIKQWETEGKTEDAIEGCKEILEIDSENSEAKEILARLEAPKVKPTPTVESTQTQPVTTPEVKTTEPREGTTPSEEPKMEEPTTPLYNIGNNNSDESTSDTPKEAPTIPEKKKSHGIVLNIVLFLVVTALIGGGVYAYLYFFQGETPKEVATPSEIGREGINTTGTGGKTPKEVVANTEASGNDQRFTDLTLIETKLEEYYAENHIYPATNELEETLGTLPTDPLDEGEFMYSYAIYDNYLGKNQEYILAGVFEDAITGNTIWTTGASPNDHPDYRDPEAPNVIFITNQGETEMETSEEVDTPKVKVKREE